MSSLFTDSSVLLWVLSAVVIVMGAMVAMGWLRQARSTPRLRDNWVAVLIAAAALGTGICGSIVLGLSAAHLPFPIGFGRREAPLLWLGTVAGCFVATALLGRSLRWPSALAAGLVLCGVTLAAQAGWIYAVGFQPGPVWNRGFVAAAAVLTVAAMAAGLWLAFTEDGAQAEHRLLSRLGSALLIGLSVVGGQETLLAGINLQAQVASVYRRELPAPLLCLVLGVLVPVVYTMMLFDLRTRRLLQRRSRRRENRSRRMESQAFETASTTLAPTGAWAATSPPRSGVDGTGVGAATATAGGDSRAAPVR